MVFERVKGKAFGGTPPPTPHPMYKFIKYFSCELLVPHHNQLVLELNRLQSSN